MIEGAKRYSIQWQYWRYTVAILALYSGNIGAIQWQYGRYTVAILALYSFLGNMGARL